MPRSSGPSSRTPAGGWKPCTARSESTTCTWLGDLPDNVSAAALGITVRAVGGVEARVIPLITPKEIDEATRLPVTYEPPGR